MLPVDFDGETKKPPAVKTNDSVDVVPGIAPTGTGLTILGQIALPSKVVMFTALVGLARTSLTFVTAYTPSLPNGLNVVNKSAGPFCE